ncbi:MAG TPA: inorganic diphosphatase, partial [Clostridiaceae bacterium]|nr:inorganic diphosphatase [Clostridiaceae bacterium]
EMLSFMEESRKAKGYDLVMLMLTDIIKENSEVLYTPEASRDMIYRAFNVQPSKNSVYLPGVVSRKKQIVPPIALVIK